MRKFRRREILLLALPGLVLGIYGTALSHKPSNVTEDDFIGGDGGPMVVLQSSVATKWLGTASAVSLGGTTETDYDAICRVSEPGQLITRYDREMLVLDDSEWGAYIFSLPSGGVGIVQQFSGETPITSLVSQTAQRCPTRTYTMTVQDNALRLLVGADTGDGQIYRFKDVAVEPGLKSCDVFSSPEALILTITPIAPTYNRR